MLESAKRYQIVTLPPSTSLIPSQATLGLTYIPALPCGPPIGSDRLAGKGLKKGSPEVREESENECHDWQKSFKKARLRKVGNAPSC